ncbi:NHL repeat [Musa troglodytarum]|uniref:NHL repeat n=1 Tax=Musa troglodytarum TaxID=320322 RepID=A0A9E7GLM4_9LILI|nr:NHL repeat [Musa troglodytarum]
MNRSLLLLVLLLAAAAAAFLGSKAQATPTGRAIVKHLSSVLKWTKPSPKTTHHDGDVVEFESGYFVETLVEGDKLGVVPHTIRVSPEGELFAVDATNNNIVRITPPLSQYSRARLVAGSFQGYSGHVDGKPSDARFYHPKGVTMDDKGNVYVADISNLAIRKIGEAGVTTIAGGKSNIAGYRDGPSEDAKFSTDFDVVYVGRTCSLLVVDRGNAALRQISLQQEDCEYQYSSVSTSDIIMVIGAVLAGYVSCLLQHGFGPLISHKNHAFESAQHEDNSMEKPTLVVETLKEEPGAGWPSLGRLLVDLSKFAVEGIGNMLLNLVPFGLRRKRSAGLSPLKDHLVMPEDKAEPPLVQKQKSPSPMSKTLHEPNVVTETAPKPQKSSKVPKFKDPSLPSKHRSSKRQEYADFYGSVEAQVSSKPQKDRVRHRHRDKSSEALFGAVGTEPKSVEMKSADYSDPKFDHYNIRSKYGPDNTFRY